MNKFSIDDIRELGSPTQTSVLRRNSGWGQPPRLPHASAASLTCKEIEQI